MELAQQLLQLRKTKGWTQAHAAAQIGIQQSYLSKLENAKFVPSDEVIAQIAAAYELAPSQLITQQGKRSTKLRFVVALPLLFSLLCFLTAHFQLVFQQTYYTYEFNLASPRFSGISKGYQVTQRYQGEKFISENDAIEHVLIGQRNIQRQENNWLYALSVVSFMLALIMIFASWRRALPELSAN
jgi:transcriptional regulator with XRE-family HTH domain